MFAQPFYPHGFTCPFTFCSPFPDFLYVQFEFAYLLVKVQEQLLEDDIQYNFVEHFYTGETVPLSPQVLQGDPKTQGCLVTVYLMLRQAVSVEMESRITLSHGNSLT